MNEEKPTKYFYSQEKLKQKKKNRTRLVDDKSKVLLKNTKILNEYRNFCQKLCNKQKICETTQKELLKHIKPKTSETENQKLKKQIEISETKQALQDVENGRSPGGDGIPIEFYKEFFKISKKDLQNPFNVLFNLKTTPKTWNHVLITVISKRKDN